MNRRSALAAIVSGIVALPVALARAQMPPPPPGPEDWRGPGRPPGPGYPGRGPYREHGGPMPPPRFERRPPPPPGGWAWEWVPGHWRWDGYEWIWRPGHWRR